MNRSYKHKFVWHAPFKVASRAVNDVFKHTSDLNPNYVFTHENAWPDDCPQDYLHIVSVRHPYYRWVSYWKHGIYDRNELPKGLNPLDALKWSSDERCSAWSLWRVITQFQPRIDYIIHAESVLEDLRKLPFISNDFNWTFTPTQMRWRSVPTNSTTWDTNWDENELRELVYERFKQDYDNLGYGKWDNYDHLWDCKPKLKENTQTTSDGLPFPRKI
jgi:hypothetical protein